MFDNNSESMLPHVAKWATDLAPIIRAAISRHSCSASMLRRSAAVLEKEIDRLGEDITKAERFIKLGTSSQPAKLRSLPRLSAGVVAELIAPLLPEGWDARLRKSLENSADAGNDLPRREHALEAYCRYMRTDLLVPMELLLTVLLMAADEIDQQLAFKTVSNRELTHSEAQRRGVAAPAGMPEPPEPPLGNATRKSPEQRFAELADSLSGRDGRLARHLASLDAWTVRLDELVDASDPRSGTGVFPARKAPSLESVARAVRALNQKTRGTGVTWTTEGNEAKKNIEDP